MTTADLLIVNAAEVVTCAGFSQAPARGAEQGVLRIIRDGAVAIAGDRILAVGASDRLRREHHVSDDQILDAAGGIVLPGFIDCHTHLVFAGDRSAEWEQRMQGKPYLEILKEGGGILSTVKKTRASAIGALVTNGLRWATACMEHGTTTCLLYKSPSPRD